MTSPLGFSIPIIAAIGNHEAGTHFIIFIFLFHSRFYFFLSVSRFSDDIISFPFSGISAPPAMIGGRANVPYYYNYFWHGPYPEGDDAVDSTYHHHYIGSETILVSLDSGPTFSPPYPFKSIFSTSDSSVKCLLISSSSQLVASH